MKTKRVRAKAKLKDNDKSIISGVCQKYMDELADELDKVGDELPEDPFLADREEYYSKVLKIIAITGATITLQNVMKFIGDAKNTTSEQIAYHCKCFLTHCVLSLTSFMEGEHDA